MSQSQRKASHTIGWIAVALVGASIPAGLVDSILSVINGAGVNILNIQIPVRMLNRHN